MGLENARCSCVSGVQIQYVGPFTKRSDRSDAGNARYRQILWSRRPQYEIKQPTLYGYLKRLQEIFKKEGIKGQELINFTLAAYNAGEGRIFDCRNFAESKNIDNMNWDKVVQIIPLMREDSILEEKSVRLGKFHGYETIAYVDSVMSIYDAFCKIHPAS